MTCFTAAAIVVGRSAAERLGAAVELLEPAPVGVGSFEIDEQAEQWEVSGYFEVAPNEIELALLAAAFGAGDFEISKVPETDWVAHVRRSLNPVKAGRFFVHGAHDAGKLPAGLVGLLVEASMAFGTGHHGTTRGCLLALEQLIERGFRPASCADIGCGTAVLAMAAAKVWPIVPWASDIDPVAIDVAKANIVANDLAGKVRCLAGSGFDAKQLQDAGPFDLVFANILKGPLIELAPDIARHVSSGGWAVLSGLLLEQADEVIAAYEQVGFERDTSIEQGEWKTLILARR